jgi:GNAT superfamily N-acetyltransferase
LSKIYFKSKGDQKAECWVEEWIKDDWKVVAESRLITGGGQILIDHILTWPEYRRKGYATQIVEHLKSTGQKVVPIGILNNDDSLAFWVKMGMEDGLGPEREE